MGSQNRLAPNDAAFVFVTTCSKNKLGSGDPYPASTSSSRPSPDLLTARSQLFSLLKRRHPEKLRDAINGPDFDAGRAGVGRYLPAFRRYARGQFMTSLEGELKDAIDLWLQENQLYFLSGLYGFLAAVEPIQNYDVELAGLVDEHWRSRRGVLTNELVRACQQVGRRVVVLDCCGERNYSQLIDWKAVRAKGIDVFHAYAPHQDGAQLRAATGVLAADVAPGTLERIECGGLFPDVNADIVFTSQVPEEARETRALPLRVGVIDTGLGELDAVDREAKRQGWTRYVRFEAVRSSIALASSYQKGLRQCVCLIPERGHDYLVSWCGGRQLKEVYDGELILIQRPIDLELRIGHR